jgi:hypothetical protein
VPLGDLSLGFCLHAKGESPRSQGVQVFANNAQVLPPMLVVGISGG